jgi:hypothetical protein
MPKVTGPFVGADGVEGEIQVSTLTGRRVVIRYKRGNRNFQHIIARSEAKKLYRVLKICLCHKK